MELSSDAPKQCISLINGNKYIGSIRGWDETSMTVATKEGDVEIFMHAVASIESANHAKARQTAHRRTMFIPHAS